jgi:hypothetical protein
MNLDKRFIVKRNVAKFAEGEMKYLLTAGSTETNGIEFKKWSTENYGSNNLKRTFRYKWYSA